MNSDLLIKQAELGNKNTEYRELKQKFKDFNLDVDENGEGTKNHRNWKDKYEALKKKLKKANKKVIELLSEKVLQTEIQEKNVIGGLIHTNFPGKYTEIPQTSVPLGNESVVVRKYVPDDYLLQPQPEIHTTKNLMDHLRINQPPIPGVRQPISVTNKVYPPEVPQLQ